MPPMMQVTSDSLSKRVGPSSNDSRIITIVCAVVGGVLLLLILCVIFVGIVRRRQLRRRAEVANVNAREDGIVNSRFSHRTTLSNSSAPLLKEDSYWKGDEDESTDHHLLPSSHEQSYDHSSQEMRFYDQPTTFALDSTPFMSESLSPIFHTRSSLPRLTIPDRASLLTTTENAYFIPRASVELSIPISPASASSDGSESLYSQPSASAHTPHASNFPTLPMAPLQRLPTRLIAAPTEDTELTQKRSDTILVAKMLKKRAGRNANKPTRSASQVSHIERAGSIKPAESLIDPSGSYRRRLAKKSRKMTTASMESLAEVLDSAAPSIAGVTPVHPSPPWQIPILPAQPPPSFQTTDRLERTSPPHNPIPLIPMPPHERTPGDVLHP